MMIRHNDSQPVVLGILDLLCRRDPVIAGDDCIDPIVKRPVDEHLVKSVPVFDPVRNVRVHIRAKHG